MRQILTFAEGDITLVECPTVASYNAEIAAMNAFYAEGFIARTIDHDGTTTVYRQDRSTFFLPVSPDAQE